MLKAVILIGGPSKGTRFRPLSLDVPKPLFPVAGLPVVQHHIDACYRLGQQRKSIPEDDSKSNVSKYCVAEVLLLGYYGDDELADFLLTATQTYPSLRIRYLREPDALGTAGGLYHFRDTILAPLGNSDGSEGEQVQAFFVMNGDVCADFPLDEMLDMHFSNNSLQSQHQQKQPVLITVMATETTRQQSVHYGCMVVDKETNIIQHYVEKPSTFVSNTVNCGVYLCSPRLFDTIAEIHLEMSNSNGNGTQQHTTRYTSSNKNNNLQQQQKPTEERVVPAMVMWMEQDVLRRLAGESGSGCSSGGDGGSRIKKDAVCSGVALAATTRNWWSQLKTAGAAIYANRHYLALRQQRQRLLQRESIDLPLPSPVKCRLATADPIGGYSTIGNVYVHPSAQVHPTALLGPNVSVGEGACIDQGVRIKESIVLQNAIIGQHSLVMHSIIGRRAKLGAWCRVEGSAACSDPNPNVAYAKMTPQLPLFNALDGRLNPSITILGCGVNVESEVVLLNSIVLPYKTLTRSYKNEIIL